MNKSPIKGKWRAIKPNCYRFHHSKTFKEGSRRAFNLGFTSSPLVLSYAYFIIVHRLLSAPGKTFLYLRALQNLLCNIYLPMKISFLRRDTKFDRFYLKDRTKFYCIYSRFSDHDSGIREISKRRWF